jgi:hypothetical protein
MNNRWIGIGLTFALAGFLNIPGPAKAQVKTDNADAPSVRLAALINGKLDGFEVTLSKGVASVTRPYAGTYCIQPSTNLNVLSVVPVVSVKRNGGESDEKFVQISNDYGHTCPDRSIVIYTYEYWGDDHFPFHQSNEVAFTIIVP